MALDLHNALAANNEHAVIEAIRNLAVGQSVTLERDDSPITLLRFATPRHDRKPSDAFRQFLELKGVLAIAGVAQNGRLLLSGGSICSTQLDLSGSLKVIKQANISKLQAADTVDRHSLEFGWMLAFQPTSPHLFPAVKQGTAGQNIAFELDFFPAYSLGELFVEGGMKISEAQRIIRTILETCQTTLHSRISPGGFENYVEKVRRRANSLLTLSTDGDFYQFLYRSGAVINGTKCRPLRELLELCESTPSLRSIIECKDPRLCHGDLIPEDILYSRYYKQTKLIDPNPQISDPLADFAKLQMSFELYYDLALRDLVSVETRPCNNQLFVRTGLVDGFQAYKLLQTSLKDWLPGIVSQFLPQKTSEPARFQPHSVNVMASLQALAIPIFHALQHNKPIRAKYFFTRGHEMLEKAISSVNNGDYFANFIH